jgi:high-affinity Fe2+/Pb2+ permease
MAFMRGMFDTADQSGHRIIYLACIEVVGNFGAMLGALVLAVIFMMVSGEMGLNLFFIVAGVVTLLIASHRFGLYRK